MVDRLGTSETAARLCGLPPLQGETMRNHNIIVIGASMGGLEALRALVKQLPADLPAAVFIVLHITPSAPSLLAPILGRESALPVAAAQNGEAVEYGRVYVAPPDHHLLLKDGSVHLTRGPRENRTRPAIDPLFRSAAVAYGPQVIGVVLTGYLDDGASGLLAIKRCNGVAIVQDPDDAAYPSMPLSAIERVEVDYRLPVQEMGKVLTNLVHHPAKEAAPIPKDILVEAAISEGTKSSMRTEENLGTLAPFACPECGGTLWQVGNHEPLRRYRCHVGHGLTVRALLASQDEQLERSLWAAMRALQERSHLLRDLARDERDQNREAEARQYETEAGDSDEHIRRLKELFVLESAD
jgi:two-component system, chemotaxis family, protein-glutamate methylesterase/glutaminase